MTRYIQEEAAAIYPTVTTAGRDDKAWAKRILYRSEQKDDTLTSIQVRFAKEAMGMSLQTEAA